MKVSGNQVEQNTFEIEKMATDERVSERLEEVK